MQGNRTVPSPSRVQGFGVCDALRVVLEPCQLRGMISELEQRRQEIHEVLRDARRQWDGLDDQAHRHAEALADSLSESAYALSVLDAIRNQLPAVDHQQPVAVIGPASVIADLIAGATRSAVQELAEREQERRGEARRFARSLRPAGATAMAWARTQEDCEQLTWFDFDATREQLTT